MLKNLLSMFKAAPVPAPAPAPKGKAAAPPGPPFSQQDAVQAALMNAIAEKRKTDPLIGAKLAAKELLPKLIGAMKNERGVHVESLLCVLGSLAGYSCQASLRAQALAKGLPENAAFSVVGTKDGKNYFFGDPLNQALAESRHSVWGLAAGAAQHNGCKALPDISGIFAYVTSTVGDDARFGVPRIPEGHSPGDLPVSYLKALWPTMLAVVKPFCESPSEWPIAFALAIQDTMDMGKNVISPELALTIVMESAVPMSKLDLATA